MTHPFTDHFGRQAADYARFRPHYPAALFDHLARLAPRRTLAWDCACGNGQATVPLAAHFTRVIGTDASAGQLAQAPRVPNIEWRLAPAEASGLADASVDLVTVAQALHWLPLAALHAEVARVLMPGGVFAVVSYGKLLVDAPAVDALVQHYYEDTVGPYWPPERRHLEEAYRELPFPYPVLTAPAFTMAVDWTATDLLGYLRSWSATAAFIDARGYDPVNALAPVLARAWPAATATISVRWPLRVTAGRPPAGVS
jgi:SAM-dependent methyltransferase